MKLLADTHVVLWWLLADDRLPPEVKELLDTEPEVYVSAVTPWELSVKRRLGKLEGPPDLLRRAWECGLRQLLISGEHGIQAGDLPLHHRDPFDRMLIAQAQLEDLTLITRDTWIPKYDVPVLRA
ncbi:type II toxin-antitoxin system VapC family toxin [Streptomyces sp. NPDC054834]